MAPAGPGGGWEMYFRWQVPVWWWKARVGVDIVLRREVYGWAPGARGLDHIHQTFPQHPFNRKSNSCAKDTCCSRLGLQ